MNPSEEIHSQSPKAQLKQLRQQIAELDAEILRLIAKRLQITKAIGENKKKLSLPVRDFRVEVEVLARARSCAMKYGLDQDLAEEIMERLMEAAVIAQTELPTPPPTNKGYAITIVGGAGRMGRWLGTFLEAQGHKIYIHDPKATPETPWPSINLEDANKNSDIVILATPLGKTPAILTKLIQLPGDPLIFDICSLKGKIAPILRKAAATGKRVTSVHPMFAPGAVLLHGRAVLLCDTGSPQATRQAAELFRPTALSIFEVPLEQHDQIMAAVLGMSHAVNLIFASALSRFGLPMELLGKAASTTFSKQIKTTAEVTNENPVLYHEIQNHNSYTPTIFQLLSDALSELKAASEDENHAHFTDYMSACATYLLPLHEILFKGTSS